MQSVAITGTGVFTPTEVITNDELVAAFNAHADLWNATHAEAIAAWQVSPHLGGRSVNHTGIRAYGHALVGDAARAGALREELLERAGTGQACALWVAVADLGLGDTDSVFEWLDRVYARSADDNASMPIIDTVDPQDRVRLGDWLACGAP